MADSLVSAELEAHHNQVLESVQVMRFDQVAGGTHLTMMVARSEENLVYFEGVLGMVLEVVPEVAPVVEIAVAAMAVVAVVVVELKVDHLEMWGNLEKGTAAAPVLVEV